MNKTEVAFTIKVYGNRSKKDQLIKQGCKLIRIIGKGKSSRYSMNTAKIETIPNDALIAVCRDKWGQVGVKFAEIIQPTKIHDSHDGKDWHYEYIKPNLTKVSGKQFKKVML